MLRLNLKDSLEDDEVAKLAGVMLAEDAYDVLIDEDADVYKPNGEVLLKFRKNVLPRALVPSAYRSLKGAAQQTTNRGVAAGATQEDVDKLNEAQRRIGSKRRFIKDGARMRAVKEDGTLSKTIYAAPVDSGIVGYFDRNPRMPYCRLTAFNLNAPDKFREALPFMRAVDDVFRTELPERYDAQRAMIAQTSPDFYIGGTAFTTVTVNMNFRTAVHKDVGDLKQGFGVLSAICAGKFTGCYFCFPKYRVAVNMRTADVLLGDVHEWHGNTPLVGRKGQYERLSCVFYYRENMANCGTHDEELERAKALRG